MKRGAKAEVFLSPFEIHSGSGDELSIEIECAMVEMKPNMGNDPLIEEENDIISAHNMVKMLVIRKKHAERLLVKVRSKPTQMAKVRAQRMQSICEQKARAVTVKGWESYIVIKHDMRIEHRPIRHKDGTQTMMPFQVPEATHALVRIKQTEANGEVVRRTYIQTVTRCSASDTPTRSGGRLAALRKLDVDLDELIAGNRRERNVSDTQTELGVNNG